MQRVGKNGDSIIYLLSQLHHLLSSSKQQLQWPPGKNKSLLRKTGRMLQRGLMLCFSIMIIHFCDFWARHDYRSHRNGAIWTLRSSFPRETQRMADATVGKPRIRRTAPPVMHSSFKRGTYWIPPKVYISKIRIPSWFFLDIPSPLRLNKGIRY